MSKDIMCMFRGQMFYELARGSLAVLDDDVGLRNIAMSLIYRIDPANIEGREKRLWLPTSEITYLVSSIDGTETEWTIGVTNGTI